MTDEKKKCGMKCEVWSRVVGYMRPVDGFNKGKLEEFENRVEFDEKKSLAHEDKK